MNQNKIRVVRHEDFKKTIETVLGHSIRPEDVAVVSLQDKLANKVSAIDLTDFIFQMVTFNKANNITSKDIAVITTDDLAHAENAKPDANVTSKAKFGKK